VSYYSNNLFYEFKKKYSEKGQFAVIIRRHKLANLFVFDFADVQGGGTSLCSTFGI